MFADVEGKWIKVDGVCKSCGEMIRSKIMVKVGSDHKTEKTKVYMYPLASS